MDDTVLNGAIPKDTEKQNTSGKAEMSAYSLSAAEAHSPHIENTEETVPQHSLFSRASMHGMRVKPDEFLSRNLVAGRLSFPVGTVDTRLRKLQSERPIVAKEELKSTLSILSKPTQNTDDSVSVASSKRARRNVFKGRLSFSAVAIEIEPVNIQKRKKSSGAGRKSSNVRGKNKSPGRRVPLKGRSKMIDDEANLNLKPVELKKSFVASSTSLIFKSELRRDSQILSKEQMVESRETVIDDTRPGSQASKHNVEFSDFHMEVTLPANPSEKLPMVVSRPSNISNAISPMESSISAKGSKYAISSISNEKVMKEKQSTQSLHSGVSQIQITKDDDKLKPELSQYQIEGPEDLKTDAKKSKSRRSGSAKKKKGEKPLSKKEKLDKMRQTIERRSTSIKEYMEQAERQLERFVVKKRSRTKIGKTDEQLMKTSSSTMQASLHKMQGKKRQKHKVQLETTKTLIHQRDDQKLKGKSKLKHASRVLPVVMAPFEPPRKILKASILKPFSKDEIIIQPSELLDQAPETPPEDDVASIVRWDSKASVRSTTSKRSEQSSRSFRSDRSKSIMSYDSREEYADTSKSSLSAYEDRSATHLNKQGELSQASSMNMLTSKATIKKSDKGLVKGMSSKSIKKSAKIKKSQDQLARKETIIKVKDFDSKLYGDSFFSRRSSQLSRNLPSQRVSSKTDSIVRPKRKVHKPAESQPTVHKPITKYLIHKAKSSQQQTISKTKSGFRSSLVPQSSQSQLSYHSSDEDDEFLREFDYIQKEEIVVESDIYKLFAKLPTIDEISPDISVQELKSESEEEGFKNNLIDEADSESQMEITAKQVSSGISVQVTSSGWLAEAESEMGVGAGEETGVESTEGEYVDMDAMSFTSLISRRSTETEGRSIATDDDVILEQLRAIDSVANVYFNEGRSDEMGAQHYQILWEGVRDTLNDIIDRVVSLGETGERKLRNSLDKSKLFKELIVVIANYQVERRTCNFLNKRVTEFYERKKKFWPIVPDKTESYGTAKHRYHFGLQELDSLLQREMVTRRNAFEEITKLRAELHELRLDADNNVMSLDKLMLQTLCPTEEFAHLKLFVEKICRQMARMRDEISVVRLELIKRQHIYGDLLEQSKKMEDIGSGLKLREYLAVHAETLHLSKKLEDRNNELTRLAFGVNTNIHTLAHIRSKQKMLLIKHDKLVGILENKQKRKRKLREEVYKRTVEHVKNRHQVEDIKSQGSLMHYPTLMLDYDVTIQKNVEKLHAVKGLREQVKNLETRIRDIERRRTLRFQRSTMSERNTYIERHTAAEHNARFERKTYSDRATQFGRHSLFGRASLLGRSPLLGFASNVGRASIIGRASYVDRGSY